MGVVTVTFWQTLRLKISLGSKQQVVDHSQGEHRRKADGIGRTDPEMRQSAEGLQRGQARSRTTDDDDKDKIASSEQVESEANQIATQLRNRISAQQATSTSIIGPVPCFFGRVAGNHRWQVVLRGPNPASLIEIPPPDGWRLEVDPLSLL